MPDETFCPTAVFAAERDRPRAADDGEVETGVVAAAAAHAHGTRSRDRKANRFALASAAAAVEVHRCRCAVHDELERAGIPLAGVRALSVPRAGHQLPCRFGGVVSAVGDACHQQQKNGSHKAQHQTSHESSPYVLTLK